MKKVFVYSTDTCPFCVMEKDFLKKNKVPFEDYNVADDSSKLEEMVKKSGQTGVPVLDIQGTIIIGFDEPRIRRELGLK